MLSQDACRTDLTLLPLQCINKFLKETKKQKQQQQRQAQVLRSRNGVTLFKIFTLIFLRQ
jgi:hypothetical protein